jgi:hypothetical protein
MNFSRRNEAEPSPPLPARTLILASSTNFIPHPKKKKPRWNKQSPAEAGLWAGLNRALSSRLAA